MGTPEVKEAVKEKVQNEKIRRASAAVDYALSRLNRCIYIVGNATTALIRLLEWIEKAAPPWPHAS